MKQKFASRARWALYLAVWAVAVSAVGYSFYWGMVQIVTDSKFSFPALLLMVVLCGLLAFINAEWNFGYRLRPFKHRLSSWLAAEDLRPSFPDED